MTSTWSNTVVVAGGASVTVAPSTPSVFVNGQAAITEIVTAVINQVVVTPVINAVTVAAGIPGPQGQQLLYRDVTLTRDGNGFITKMAYSDGDVDITRDGNGFITFFTDATFTPTATITLTRNANNFITAITVT